MQIYCDESGGVGRGVMTLAAVSIEADEANRLIAAFKRQTGIRGEVKGSRIELNERAFFFSLFAQSNARAIVSVATRALGTNPGGDRGDHDARIYAQLIEKALAPLLLEAGGCASVLIDDGRYSPETLSEIRAEVAGLIGACGKAALEDSRLRAGLQVADVIANSFFARALPGKRQARIAAMVAPLLQDGTIRLEVLRLERLEEAKS